MCQDDLFCGSNNCPVSLGFDSEVDCCYQPTVGDEHFCTSDNPCAIDEGDCDSVDECQTNLFCDISISCPAYLGFATDMNCCYQPTAGDENFCTTADPCSVDEGDCDTNNECQSNLFCDITISCPAYLGFASNVNCCSNGSGCKSYNSIIYYYFLLILFSSKINSYIW